MLGLGLMHKLKQQPCKTLSYHSGPHTIRRSCAASAAGPNESVRDNLRLDSHLRSLLHDGLHASALPLIKCLAAMQPRWKGSRASLPSQPLLCELQRIQTPTLCLLLQCRSPYLGRSLPRRVLQLLWQCKAQSNCHVSSASLDCASGLWMCCRSVMGSCCPADQGS